MPEVEFFVALGESVCEEVQLARRLDRDGPVVEYRSPKHVQILFLKRIRNKLRAKYRDPKVDQKRLQNRVRDVAKSREEWRRQAEELQAANEQLARENAELREDLRLRKRASFFRASE